MTLLSVCFTFFLPQYLVDSFSLRRQSVAEIKFTVKLHCSTLAGICWLMKMTTRCCIDAAMVLIDDYGVDPRLQQTICLRVPPDFILRGLCHHC